MGLARDPEGVGNCPPGRATLPYSYPAPQGWRVQRDLRGIVGGDSRPDPDLRTRVERQLADLLRAEGIPPRAVYRPGEVCRLLRISRSTLLVLCQLAEHPAARRAHPRALDSFLVGCHHRISHAALVEWLERNQKFQRDNV